MSGAVSGNDGRIPQEQIFFLSRFFLPVRRELPEPEARYAEDSFFHQTAAFRMDGVQGQILWNEGCVFFCGCLPVEQFRQSGGFIFSVQSGDFKSTGYDGLHHGGRLDFSLNDEGQPVAAQIHGGGCRFHGFSALCIQGDVEAFSSLRLNSCLFHFRFRDDGGIFQEQPFPLHFSMAVAEFVCIRRVSFRNRAPFPVQLLAVRMHHPDGDGGNRRRNRFRAGRKRETKGGKKQ